jgi:hypothetical protein
MDHLREREMGWSKRQHIQISADSFSPSQCPESCVLACVLQQRSDLSGRYMILISIVDPECRESQHASGRAHAGRCSKLLTNCSPPARRRDGEYRAGLVASTVKRQSPEASKLVPLPQSAIYSLTRDLRTAAASCGRDSTITVSYPVWSSATRPAPQKTMTFDPSTLWLEAVFFHPSHPTDPNMQQVLQMHAGPPNLRRHRRRTTRFEQYCIVLFYVRLSFFLSWSWRPMLCVLSSPRFSRHARGLEIDLPSQTGHSVFA